MVEAKNTEVNITEDNCLGKNRKEDRGFTEGKLVCSFTAKTREQLAQK